MRFMYGPICVGVITISLIKQSNRSYVREKQDSGSRPTIGERLEIDLLNAR